MKIKAMVLLLAARSVFAACPDFATVPHTYAAGNVYQVVAADVNGDGRSDLISALFDIDKLNVRLGNGDGTFETLGTDYTVGTKPIAIAVADFNHDGRPDIAIANYGSNNVSVLLRNATGFNAAANFAVGTTPTAILAIDISGDGNADIVTSNQATNNVSVLIGNGSGSFGAHADRSAGAAPTGVTAGDFNHDGILDLAVSDFSAGAIAILIGAGGGTFNAPLSYTGGSGPETVVTADFDSDGNLDLAVADFGAPNVAVLFGNGNGTFQNPVSYPVEVLGSPNSLSLGDVNDDGKLDLIVATYQPNVAVLTGNDDGSFNPYVTFPASAQSRWVDVADFDGDGKQDLAIGSTTSLDDRLNTGTCTSGCGAFASGDNASLSPATRTADMLAADVNGDGDIDLVYAQESNGVQPGGRIYLGNGDGSFRTGATIGGLELTSIAAADFDRDGVADLVASSGYGYVYYYRGLGSGTFSSPVQMNAGSSTDELTVADFNNDGKLDIASIDAVFGYVAMFLGNGDGTFITPAPTFAVGGQPESLVSGDFDRDGNMDLAAGNSNTHDISVLLGNGDGTFQTQMIAAVSGRPLALATADLNKDGVLDLIVPDYNGVSTYVLLGAGDGTFSAPNPFYSGTAMVSIVAADFDRDGNIDVALRSLFYTNTTASGTGLVTVLFGGGDGTLHSPLNLTTAPAGSGIVAADFNRDGKPDLAASNTPAFAIMPVRIDILLNSCLETDLKIFKTHADDFARGQSGATYTLRVKNIGSLATSGTVTVTDTLPTGLTAAAVSPMSGSGWTCTAATMTCTTSAIATSGNELPPITVKVDVAANAAATVTNHAHVSGGGEVGPTTNNYASDVTVVKDPSSTALIADTSSSRLAAPVTLTATVTTGAAGSVSFYEDGATLLGTAPISSDVAQLTTTMIHLGGHTITAVYGGDVTYATSSSPGLAHTVTGAPATNLVALTASTTSISLTWTGDADAYDVYRRDSNGTYVLLTTTATTSLTDGAGAFPVLQTNTTYRYRVMVVDSASNEDFATTVVFSNDPAQPNVTPIKAEHITQLLACVNAMRAAVSLSAVAFANDATTGSGVMVEQMSTLRSALDEALDGFSLPHVNYTAPALTQIKASHINDMRAAMR
jgi:uncharacterized repeat protein (TIGR01451 family)